MKCDHTLHLSDICDYVKDKIAITALNRNNYVSTENMLANKAGIVRASSLPAVAQTQAFLSGDVLVSNIRPYFKKIWFAKFDGGCSNDVLVFRAKEGVSSRFLYYVLANDTFFAYSTATSKGTKMPRGDKTAIMGYEVPKITPEEQEKITAILSALDDKIELNNKINANLEQQAQALFKAWFVDFEPFGGSKPRTWVETDIYQLANVIYGAPFKSAQFNTKGIGTPIIRIRDLKEQQFATYTTEVHPKGYLLRPGDLVVGMDGEFRPYIWGNGEAWLNQRVCVFEPKRPKGKVFLYCLIKPLLFACERMQVATTVIHIGKKDFDTFRFTLPTEDVLEMFDALTTPLYDMIVSNKRENRRLAEIRDTLLPHLLARGTQTQQQRN